MNDVPITGARHEPRPDSATPRGAPHFNPVIFREYDVRGVVGREFDCGFAYVLGRAYVTYLARRGVASPNVALGCDARLSSPDLVAALSEGLRDSGAHVIHLGLVTTPMTYFATFELPGADGAIMVTGSHNPPDCNGFKISVGRSTIHGDEIQALRAIVETRDFVCGRGDERRFDIAPQYLDRYRSEFAGLEAIPLVLDCGNGAAGCIARRLFEAAGLDPVILFEEPDGAFPNHHPDPTVAENLRDLAREVVRTGARAGIGFDGDADRIGVVDDRGRVIDGDELLALYSRFVLADRPAEKIVGDVKCSDRLFDYIARYGGTPVMWKSGHSSIKEKVKAERAPFGGELAGHIFFADRNYGYDDALYAGLRLAEILSKTGRTIGELLDDLPQAFNTPEIRLVTSEEKKHSIVEALRKVFTPGTQGFSVNLIDGLRVSFPEGWALARASNTQPVLVLRFEARSERALAAMRARFDAVIEPLL